MRRLKIGAIILSAALIMGCSSNNSSQAEYDSLMAEKQSLEAELAKQKETTSQEATQTETTQAPTTTEKDTLTQEVTTEVVKTTEQENGDVEIVAEYNIPSYACTFHFVIVKNNTDKTLNVTANSKAYTADGSLVSVDDAEFDALGSGCTSIITEMFDTDAEIAYCDTEILTKTDGWYESVIQDLSYTETLIKDGAIYEVTNNGDKTAMFVQGYAIFFNGNEPVDWNYTYFTDDDSELKPGKSISKQLSCSETFDRVEFYLDGRR